jgi:glutathione peroxidase
MNNLLRVALMSLIPVVSSPAEAAEQKAEPAKGPAKDTVEASIHGLTAKSLDGKSVSFAEYQGKVLLIVNTASECGFTGQYASLEALSAKYKERGLLVLGFPSNDFHQEAGSSEAIAKFCKVRYGVTFPLFEKGPVTGAAASPVFKFLARKHGEPKWNFYKYLVGKDGQVIGQYPSRVSPDSGELISAIEAALR